jgi:peroxiredoxin
MIATQALPKPGERLPAFTLQSSAGRRIALYDYRGRRNLALALVGKPADEAARAFLTDLAAHHSDFAEEEAEVLAVVWGSVAEAEWIKSNEALPFPVLADEEGAVHHAFGVLASDGDPVAAIYIADRFGEIFAAYRIGAGQPFPRGEEILEWLRFIGLQCPE